MNCLEKNAEGRSFSTSQWIQVGGNNPGMPPYQEGSFFAGPAVSYVGYLAANVGHGTACQAARQRWWKGRLLGRRSGLTFLKNDV